MKIMLVLILLETQREMAYHEACVAAPDAETLAWERENHPERLAKVERDKEVNMMHANFLNLERCFVNTLHLLRVALKHMIVVIRRNTLAFVHLRMLLCTWIIP
jgi:hypothetical protein